jgi:streptogramin lyase
MKLPSRRFIYLATKSMRGRPTRGLWIMVVAGLLAGFLSFVTASAQSQTPSATAPAPQANAKTPSEQSRENWRTTMSRTRVPSKGCFTSSYPSTAWQQVQCATPLATPFSPAIRRQSNTVPTVGDGYDFAAQVSGLISSAVGSFDSVTGLTSESGYVKGHPPAIPNAFSLQLNTNKFSSPMCNGAADCSGWVQFLFSNSSLPGLEIEYWLFNYLNYNATCPDGGWNQDPDPTKPNCYLNSPITPVPTQTIANLGQLTLQGFAEPNGNDEAILSGAAGDNLYAVSQDSVLFLAQYWNAAEFNVFGDCCYSQANFNGGVKLVVRTSVDNGTQNAPTCVLNGFTGFTAETNNLTLGTQSECQQIIGRNGVSSPAIVFPEASPALFCNWVMSVSECITEFPTPTQPSGPAYITTGQDGALWFTEYVGQIGRIPTTATHANPMITEYSNNVDLGGNFSIIPGPPAGTGLLWFTGGDSIGNIISTQGETQGHANSYSLAANFSYAPAGIAWGSDGNLWFPSNMSQAVGRIDPQGNSPKSFPQPDQVYDFGVITTGPDGQLWYGGYQFSGGNNGLFAIESMNTAGAWTGEFTISPNEAITSITTGPDGKLWFTECPTKPNMFGKIGRITTQGTGLAEYPILSPGSCPTGITPGPDGALWFADQGTIPISDFGNKIGRITIDGKRITEFPTPAIASGPTGITWGPDGGLWFTESNANNIGRIVPPVMPTSLVNPTNTHDFNGDGWSDIAWLDGSGDLAFWLMSGTTVLSSGGISGVPAAWSIVGQRDFNGDGAADLLWRDTSGNTAMWFMSGTTVASSASVGNIPINWTVAGVADFNGDGLGDLLWRDSSGDIAVWLMNGATVMSSAGLGSVPTNWAVVATGDFNGDGMSDILWRDNLGNTSIWFMNGTSVASSAGVGNIPTNWSVAGTGDFNGDGMSDIVWRDNVGDTSIWLMNSAAVLSAAGLGNVPTTWSIALVSDYNGDGKSDLMWRDSLGNTATWFMNGVTVIATAGVGNIPTTWTVQSVNAE